MWYKTILKDDLPWIVCKPRTVRKLTMIMRDLQSEAPGAVLTFRRAMFSERIYFERERAHVQWRDRRDTLDACELP